MSELGGQNGFSISSFSGGGGNCVAVRRNHDGSVQVRHSTKPDVELCFTLEEWAAFVRGVKAGEFDPAA